MSKPRVRFAPSPTGHLHIGGVRAAMFNWLFARHHNGTFLVRIEDTDIQRSKKEYVDSIVQSLSWLDLESDEPIIYQSERTAEYKKVVQKLLEQGLAYPCFCEPKSAEEKMSDLQHGVATKYDGTCRDKAYTPQDLEKPHAIRFKLPQDSSTISFDDQIRGLITFPMDQLDDFVIWRRDDMPTYNFCVVLDDIFMRITHVIRGEDHISNTPKQILIYEALQEKTPIFAHLPLILGPGGQKLSKRDAAVSVIEYKKQGFLPNALFNYLVRLGWSHGDQEVFSRKEMIECFKIDNIGKKGAIFDLKKLLWLNGVYLRELSFENFLKAASDTDSSRKKTLTNCWENVTLRKIYDLYRERIDTVCNALDEMISLAQAPSEVDIELIRKWLTDDTKEMLAKFLEQMEGGMDLMIIAKDICKAHGTKLVALAQPLRLALVGKLSSPGVFALIPLIGIQESKKRIELLISKL